MELSDKEWEVIEPRMQEPPSGKQGRPWRGNREVLDGILWVLRTGAPWRDLPKNTHRCQFKEISSCWRGLKPRFLNLKQINRGFKPLQQERKSAKLTPMGFTKKYPSYQTCHRRFQQWSSDGTLEKVQMALTEMLEKRKKINMSECCIDAKFVPAKKGGTCVGPTKWAKGQNW